MAAPTRLGIQFFTSSGGTATVPTGTKGVVAFASHWSSSASTLSSISLGGAGSFAITNNLAVGAGGSNSTGQAVAHAAVTTTGSQTLTFAFSATPGEGPVVALVYYGDIDNTDWIRATAADSDTSTTNPTATVSSATDDEVLVYHQKFGAAPTASTGFTSRGTTSNNSEFVLVATANSPGGTSTTYTATSSDYSSLGMVAVKGSVAGSTGTMAKTAANDTMSAAGTSTVVATMSKTAAGDSMSAAGSSTAVATMAKTANGDTMSASGSVGSEVTASMAATTQGDSMAGTGSPIVVATMARAAANDTMAAAGSTTVVATMAKTANGDSMASFGTSGTVSVTSNERTKIGAGV